MGELNIRCLGKVLIQYKPPELLQCSLLSLGCRTDEHILVKDTS